MFFPQRETSGNVNNYNLNRELNLQETRYVHYTEHSTVDIIPLYSLILLYSPSKKLLTSLLITTTLTRKTAS